MNKIYWTTKNGNKIDVDLMSEEHLRNTLKMIIRNSENYKKQFKKKKEKINFELEKAIWSHINMEYYD